MARRRDFALLAGALMLGCAAAPPPVAPAPVGDRTPAPKPAPAAPAVADSQPATVTRPTSRPHAGDPSIFEHPLRGERLQIERVMDLLGIERGSTVADVGAGGGWFSVRAARRAGPSGRVVAVEINPSYVDAIAERARREQLDNLRSQLGTEDDPGLQAESFDAVLLLKTYHELSEPIAMLSALHRALRPSGRLGIIDRNGRGDDHGIDEAVVRAEAERAGFSLVARHDWKSREERVDYFVIFTR
jgi:predicted methyltransferase